ncbi:MAG: hypothetical protein HY554_03800 [Elusimicrobia bacterium]|nr:hypothetical protein [Elusimicrobiota bacterium]
MSAGARRWSRNFACALGGLAISLLLFRWAGRWHDGLGLPAGGDPLLAALPRVDWRGPLTYLWFALHAVAWTCWLVRDAALLPYRIGMVALHIVVRAAFIALTPVGPPSGMLDLYREPHFSPLRGQLYFDSELFFSGHTSFPFLYGLLTARPLWLRRGLFAASGLMAAGVLLTRNHYCIDVLGAWFVTYAAFAAGRRLLGSLASADPRGAPLAVKSLGS